MVQLGLALGTTMAATAVLFQFLYGAIGIARFIIRNVWSMPFQFLYGATSLHPLRLSDHVSIPLWCNWDKARSEELRTILNSFNSFMVQLGFMCSTTSIHSIPEFQFLYGAIGIISVEISAATTFVSIPLWCNWDIHKYRP